jgi:hypothetical protein
MHDLGLVPAELMAMALWRQLGNARTEDRAPVRLALVQAWDWRDDYPLTWAKAWREARHVAGRPPPEWWMTDFPRSWAVAA